MIQASTTNLVCYQEGDGNAPLYSLRQSWSRAYSIGRVSSSLRPRPWMGAYAPKHAGPLGPTSMPTS